MGRIAALAAGITAAIAAGWAFLTRRRSGGGTAPTTRGRGRGKGKAGGRGGKGKAGGRGRDRRAVTAGGSAPGPATEARQELSTTGAEKAAPGTGEEAARYSDETRSGEAPAGGAVESATGAADAPGGELQAVKGIGAVSQERLAELGVTTLAQVAAWTDDDVDRIAEQIKISAERIKREDWVGQARAALEG